MKVSRRILMVLLLITAAAAYGQKTTVEVKQGEVVGVYGNTLAYRAPDGTVKEVNVPADFKFTVDGQQLTVIPDFLDHAVLTPPQVMAAGYCRSMTR